MTARTCIDCGSADARPGKERRCNPCKRIARKAWRARRKAEGNPVRSTKLPREYHRAYEAKRFLDPEKRERRNAQMRAYAKAHGTREHHKARWQVRRALAAGRLVRCPCEVCGAEPVDAHHDDYSKPLAVRWLCRPHHVEYHAKAGGQS